VSPVQRAPAGPGALAVERFGFGGRSVVLLHGLGTSGFLWRNVAPVIAEHGHSAFAIDLLGHGESSRPLLGDYGIAAQARGVAAAMTALGTGRAVLVGNDLGGAVALRLAADAPERVAGLVLINAMAPGEELAGDVRALRRFSARDAVRTARGMLGVSALLGPVLAAAVADPARMPPALVGRYLAPFVGRDGVAHLLALARAIRAADLDTVSLGRIAVPSIVVRGDEDPWAGPDVAERLATAIPGARLARIAGVGRLAAEDDPGAVASIVLEAISGASPEPDLPVTPVEAPTLPPSDAL
jgi:2-hydroxymuconate-semialdehyde hydrolase